MAKKKLPPSFLANMKKKGGAEPDADDKMRTPAKKAMSKTKSKAKRK